MNDAEGPSDIGRSIPSILRGSAGATAAADAQANRTTRAAVLEILYERLRGLAAGHLRNQADHHSLQATALANEAVVKLLNASDHHWVDERHVLATASAAMRQILVDHARRRGRLKRGGNRTRVLLDTVVVAFEAKSPDLVALDDALDRLREMDAGAAQLVELRFFLGLSMPEIVEVTGTPLRTLEREWTAARAWLLKELDTEAGR